MFYRSPRPHRGGGIRHAIDFTKLRQLLGDDAVDDVREAYEFTWVGKQAARREAATPVNKTLRPVPESSVDWDTTQNIYIEGDNLDALKLLQKAYLGKVKMIYIDPPYNTGNDFVYHDVFKQSACDYDEAAGNVDELGNRLVKNTESNGRFHSDWCSMIYPRLQLAKSLLSDDGVIFISIDDSEQKNLKNICDEVFGETNFLAQCVRKRRDSQANLSKNIAPIHEYVLIYGASSEAILNKVEANIDESSYTYKNPDNDPRGPYVTMPCTNKGGAVYSVTTPTGIVITEEWRFKQDTYNSLYSDNRIVFPKGGDGKPRYKLFLSEKKKEGVLANTWLDKTATNQDATREIKQLFGNLVFDTPKPVGLIQFCLQLATDKNSIILDFFAGSSTTAQAVIKQNAKDGGNRRFILVQLPEKTSPSSLAYKDGYMDIALLGLERIRRAGKKIQDEVKEKQPDLFEQGNGDKPKLDTGFRVYRIDSSNMKDVYFAPKDLDPQQLDLFADSVKEDRSELDLLYGCILNWGLQLSLPMTTDTVDGQTIYTVNEGDLVACFGSPTGDVVKAIAGKKPQRVLFRDSRFKDDAQKINIYEQFKQQLGWSDDEAINNIRVI